MAGRRRRGPLAWLLPMGPALLLLLVFVAGPILWCLHTAFTNAAMSGAAARAPEYVGLDNFHRVLTDPELGQAVWLTVVFTVGSAVLGQNCLGMLLAVLLHRRHRVVRNVVGGTVVAAWVLPEIVAAFALQAFLTADGTLNAVLAALGLGGQDWLYSAPVLAVVLGNVWRGTAFSMLVYQAALAEVPTELVEAAQVDGAGPLRRFWHVVLPLLRRTVVTNLMLVTLQTVGVFTLVYVMTAGGPGTASQTLPLLMYERAFGFGEIGYGTTVAFVLLVVAGTFAAVYARGLREEV
ncbi:carbohydrate ABC transporter permease [Streptoalloteichus hindustanus]|uniref:Carbohydrate ABC transporter membrane protein 1, CUT1 family n=1 Tax=Streptoalloteichus hindustanus TaxID=2017 RepID=A0A1M4UIV5_STRHI|nr:sugar ABC transporter permease [Streptoalloteichus hindustanus]SHE56584.1 carbohydrate ABC transporter membrane protein 1, CUT1 family [Streptoalloteichus hindustanus]